MASVYKRGKAWWVGFTTAAGVRRNESTKARTRDEAKKLAAEIEAKQERIRRGLEVTPGDERMTFAELFEVWWERHGSRLATTGGKAAALRKHALPVIGDLVLREVTDARLELLFDAMGETLMASTVNTLRASLRSLIGWATKRGLWHGENPVAATERRPEQQVERDELTAEEIPLVLAQLKPHRRALAATAIGTGGRKGELGALRIEDVDLAAGVVRFGRSWSRDTTKAGTTKTVPIASWLRPYLVEAIETARAAGSEFVFPGPTGGMMRVDVKLAAMLRRAMARAGLTRGWMHTCRRTTPKRCGFKERREHNRVEPCPRCSFSLWPVPIHRRIRWHDLRGSTATLLARSGASPAVAGRVLRHSDPRLTLKVYTRVTKADMLAALDAMAPGLMPASPPSATSEPVVLPAAVNAAAPVLHHLDATRASATSTGETVALLGTSNVGPGGFEPPTPTVSRLVGPVGTAVPGVSPRASGVAFRGVERGRRNARTTDAPPFPSPDAAQPLQSPLGLVPQLLTVREVAAALRCSTATVYALCERGELAHVRVSNAIRIEPAALRAYLARGRTSEDR